MNKTIVRLISLLFALLSASACYDPYVKDYDYDGVYVAYQYDLRTFVVGEGMKFKLSAALGGVLENRRDRVVYFEIDTSIVRGPLNLFWPDAGKSFNAFSEISGNTSYGKVSQNYVYEDLAKAGYDGLAPLPSDAYDLSCEKIVIPKGRMHGSVTVTADSLKAVRLMSAGGNNCYAIGFKLLSADADTLLLSKSYQVCAVRLENMFYGYWYHGGETTVVDDEGNILEKRVYPTSIPSDQGTNKVYLLSTCAPNAVVTNYLGSEDGSLKLVYNGGFVKVVSNDSRKVVDMESTFNRAPLLQDRKLFLNYRYRNSDGTTSIVKDTLSFRNRIRDGVNEWQDTNTSHYYE